MGLKRLVIKGLIRLIYEVVDGCSIKNRDYDFFVLQKSYFLKFLALEEVWFCYWLIVTNVGQLVNHITKS